MPHNPSADSPPAPIDVSSSQIPSGMPIEPEAPAEVKGSSEEAGNKVIEAATNTHDTISDGSKTRKSSDMSIDKDTTVVEAANTSLGSTTHSEQLSADPQRDPAPSSIRVDKTETTETTTATDEIDKEEKKDQASSLTNPSTAPHSQNPPQTRSSKRKANESTSSRGRPEKRAATSEANGKEGALVPARPKRSFLSKLVRRLVPCVSPRGHTVDVTSMGVHDGKAEPKQSAPSLKERQQDADRINLNGAPRDQTIPPPKEDSAKPLPEPTEPIVPPPLTVPPNITSSSETDTVMPPTPTKHKPVPLEPEAVTSSGVQPPGSTGDASHHHAHATRDSGDESDGTSFTDDDVDEVGGDEVEDEDERLIMNGGVGIPIGPDGVPRPLLPPIAPQHVGRKCLVLDLDETLVHSSFKHIQQADYVVPVEIEYNWHNVYVIKRPGVDSFLKKMGEIYEVVVFTASLSKYADPVLDKLDINHVVSHRLFRESCYNHKGNYVKDLSQLGRPMTDTIILDNSPASYIFHPNNAVPVSSWFNDPHDTELTDLCPFLADLSPVDDVRGVLDGGL